MKIGEKDINPVTKLPALREVIDWFASSMSTVHSDSYLSVTVYEISKYIYILENYGIKAIDEMLSNPCRLVEEFETSVCVPFVLFCQSVELVVLYQVELSLHVMLVNESQ